MEDMKDAALGIDLGTTSCVVSVVINGKPELIPNRSQNSNVTPSYVCYRDGKETFGVVAKDQAYRYPECTIFNAKRIIGRTWGDPMLEAEMQQWPFEVKNVNGFPKIKIGTRTKYPQEISGKLLEIFCRGAEAYLQMQPGSVKKAVITVPANFNDLQRRATIEAGEMAGIEVLDILNEPTAAAIAYKFEGRSEQKTKTLLIYDLGGGTFDVAIVKVTENSVLCLNIDGDTHLGGEDFDNAMVTHCATQFKKEVGINLLEQKEIFKSAVARLRLECEKAKMALSSCEIYPIEVQCIYDGNDLSVEVSRAEFEGLIKPHVEKTIEIVNRAIQNAKDIRSSNDIDEIILIGGSTRVPLVHTMLGNAFRGKPLNFAIDPELTVSRGAAVHAAILSGTCEGVKIQDFQIKEQPAAKKVEDSAHATESLEAAQSLVEYKIRLRVESLPAPKSLKITKSTAHQPVNVSMAPLPDCHFSSLLSLDENRVVFDALVKGRQAKIIVVASTVMPSRDDEIWEMKIFNEPICLVKDDLEKSCFIQAFNSKEKKFVYRKKVEKDFSYLMPKPGFIAFEDDDGLLVGVVFHDFTEAHLFSETLTIQLQELKKDSERAVGGASSKLVTIRPFLVPPKASPSTPQPASTKPAAKKMCFEESAVFKEINNDMKNLAISSGFDVYDIQLIWCYHFDNVKREKVRAGQCICGTISCVDWNRLSTNPELFKTKYESILKRTVQAFNKHRDRATQDCFCRKVLKNDELMKVKVDAGVVDKAYSDLKSLAKTSGYDREIFGEIAETRRDFLKENLEKNVCVCSTFHCRDWKLVSDKSGRAFTETFTQKYESILKGLTEEFNKDHDEGNQDCFCTTVTRPLLVELRLSKSEKGVKILKEIAELKASAGKTFKMCNVFSDRLTCYSFVIKLTEVNCMCKTLFSWIWDEVCKKSPQMKQESSFKAKFETTFQRAVEEFNKLRDEASDDCFCRTFSGLQEEKYIHITLRSRANWKIHWLRWDLKLYASYLIF